MRSQRSSQMRAGGDQGPIRHSQSKTLFAPAAPPPEFHRQRPRQRPRQGPPQLRSPRLRLHGPLGLRQLRPRNG